MLGVVTSAVLVGFVSIELGAEFFAAMNTALNLATIMYVRHTRKDLAPKVEHIEAVANTLDTRQEGGRREHDPPPCEGK